MADKNIHKFNNYTSQFSYEDGIATGETYVGAHLYGDNNDIGEVHYNKKYYVIYTFDIKQEDLEEPIVISSDMSFLNNNIFDVYINGKYVYHNSGNRHREPFVWQFEKTGHHTVSFFFQSNSFSNTPSGSDLIVRITISPYIKSFPYSCFKLSGIQNIKIPYGTTGMTFSDVDWKIIEIDSIVVDERNTAFTSRDNTGKECNAIFKKNASGGPVELVRGCKNTVIPSTIRTIAKGAFSGVFGLKKINISKNVTSIGNGIFTNCPDLEYITVESGGTYNDGNGRNVIMNGTTLIASCKNSLIPSNATTCVDYALGGGIDYGDLTFPSSFYMPANNQASNANSFTVNSGGSYLPGNNINILFTTDSNYIHCGCNDTDFSILSGYSTICFLNASYGGNKSLSKLDFNEKNIKVSEIRRGTFKDCINLEYVHLNESYAMRDGGVGTVNVGGLAGGNLFSGCKKLSSFTFSQTTVGSLTKLGVEYPLNSLVSTTGFCSGCTELQEFKLEYFTNLEMIGSFAFSDCKSLSSMTIPSKVSSIDRGAFKNCQSLTSITVNANNNTFTDDGKNVIMSTSAVTGYTEYSIKTKVNLFPSNCIIAGCNTSEIPSGATSIGNYAFLGATGLTGVDLSNITTIGDSSFTLCRSLSSVTIPSGLTSIGNLAFAGCTGLEEIHIQGDNTSVGYCAFNKTANNFKIYVPIDQVENYKSKPNWSYYADKIVGE